MGHVLVMGRRTYESIGHPLPGRTTVVITRQRDWSAGADEVVRAGDVPGALELASELDDQVFVVGGGQIYDEAVPLADRLELTLVDAEPEGDTFFPEVDWSHWREVAREAGDGVDYVTYERARD